MDIADVKQLIDSGQHWELLPTGDYEVFTQTNGGTYTQVARTLLAQVDPRIPPTLDLMAAYACGKVGVSRIVGHKVSRLPALLQQPVVLKDCRGAVWYPLIVDDVGFSTACSVELFEQPRRLRVSTYCAPLSVGVDPATQQPLYFFTGKEDALPVNVDCAWMDQHYPGWQHRLEVGQALGLQADELLNTVCQSILGVTETVSLPSELAV